MERTIKILAVDDKPANLFALESSLDFPGVEVVKASSGNEALSLVLENDFALVLLDVQMPDMDGFEAAELMRSNPATQHIPIIFVTAISVEQKHVFRGYEAGAVDYLFKPIDPEVLASKVAIFCELFRVKRKAELDKKMFETTLRCIGDGVVATDVGGKITFINPIAELMCEVSGELAVGQNIADVIRVVGTDNPLGFMDIVTQQKVCGSDSSKVELELQKKNDTVIPVDFSGAPIIDSSGESLGYIFTFNDISQRVEAEKERAELNRKLRQSQKMEAVGTLAGGIAHDFNNILTPILGYAELTIDKLEEDSGLHHNMTELLKAANRAKDLVKQILTFSRQQEKLFANMKIQPVVKETMKLLRATFPSTIEIQSEISPDCEAIFAEPTQVHQVIMNLCTNAYHAMGVGGVLKVSLVPVVISDEADSRGLEPGKYVRLSVSDTGVGISSDLHGRIFEPYYTTKGVGAGTGMGLAMVHGIVDEHKGRILLSSTVGVGSTFEVYFPVATGDSVVASQPQIVEAPHGHANILVLDDEEAIVCLVGEILEKFGYTHSNFTSSVEALAEFSADPQKYDLIVTDQTMPEMTGVTFAEHVHRIRPEIPIVLCSGYSTDVNEKNAADLNVTYLGKPVCKNLLATTIDALLTKRVLR
nr:response regulator [Desulfobulbaceae bacterium]